MSAARVRLADRRIDGLATALGGIGAEGASVGVVLGSGLGHFADRLEGARELFAREVPELPQSTVPGHAGRFVVGGLGGHKILAQSGRVHLYEGHGPRDVTVAVRAFARLGVRCLVLTNAAGGLREDWPPGTLMAILDHLNLQGATPLTQGEARAPCPYDPRLRGILQATARELGEPLVEGVYAALLGPSYETPAEVRALRWMGADAVGMSTAMEALAAGGEGVAVAGVSCITNLAAGIGAAPLHHGEVLEVGRQTSARFARLLEVALPRMATARPS